MGGIFQGVVSITNASTKDAKSLACVTSFLILAKPFAPVRRALCIKGSSMRLFLVVCLLCAFDSYACTRETPVEFKPYAVKVSESSTLIELRLLFPASDKADSPMYLDSLTLNLPNKLSVELSTYVDASLQGYYQADIKIAKDFFEKAQIISSYNFNDIDGKSLSLCANWKSFLIAELLASEVNDV